MEELIKAMSDTDLVELRDKYPDNESVKAVIDGVLAERANVAAQAKVAESFAKDIEKLAAKLAHPEAIHNVYMAWREVEVNDTTAAAIPVEVIVTPAITDSNGAITTPAITAIEERYPLMKVFKWVVELNKGFQVGKAVASGTPQASKRAISVNKRNGQLLEFKGNYTSARKACDAEKAGNPSWLTDDSGTRELLKNGYVIDAYTGTDFKA